MRTNTRSGLIALVIAAQMVAGAALLSNAPALGGQFLLSPTVLMAEAETTEQGGMMGQGGMGGMMNRGEMDQGEIGGMMNMMQQMSRMMESCSEMMEAHVQHEREPGNAAEPEGGQE